MANMPQQQTVTIYRGFQLSALSPILRQRLLKLPGIISVQGSGNDLQIAYQLPILGYADIIAVLAELDCLPVSSAWERGLRWLDYFLEDNRREHLQSNIGWYARLQTLYIELHR